MLFGCPQWHCVVGTRALLSHLVSVWQVTTATTGCDDICFPSTNCVYIRPVYFELSFSFEFSIAPGSTSIVFFSLELNTPRAQFKSATLCSLMTAGKVLSPVCIDHQNPSRGFDVFINLRAFDQRFGRNPTHSGNTPDFPFSIIAVLKKPSWAARIARLHIPGTTAENNYNRRPYKLFLWGQVRD